MNRADRCDGPKLGFHTASRGERLRKPAGDFRRDAGAGVFHFGDDFPFVALKTQNNCAASGQDVRGIVEQVEKEPAQAADVPPEPGGRRFVLQLDAHGFDTGLGVQFRQQFVDKSAVALILEKVPPSPIQP